MPKKKTTNNNTKIINIIRWVSLLPVACAEIWGCWLLALSLDKEYNSYYRRAYEIPAFVDSIFSLFIMALILVAPLLAIYFSTRFLAPKNKTATSLIVLGLSIVCMLCMAFYGMTHMAY